MANQKVKRRRRKRRAKKILLIIEIIIILAVIGIGVIFFVPNAKNKFMKSFISCAPGKALVSSMLREDYETSIQDKDFDASSISVNDGLSISSDFTNIILFGGDSRDQNIDSLSHGDSMIIMSINKKTGDIKMQSIYRDTVLKYVVDEETIYDKATNSMYEGGIPTTIAMLNENLDLNITDYAIVNFAGLANIVDALGGMDVTITDDERQWINNYLGETRNVTGMTTPNVETSGNVHLTGLQTTAYCRIRAVSFQQPDGTTINNDYGRAARQRYVLEQLFKQAKSAGVSELLNVAKTLFSESSSDEKFLSSSLTFDEVLDLLPVALDCNLAGSSAFPTEYITDRYKSSDCILVKGLSNNVSALHEYLFGVTNYEPTEAVQTIHNKLIKLTGVKPE